MFALVRFTNDPVGLGFEARIVHLRSLEAPDREDISGLGATDYTKTVHVLVVLENYWLSVFDFLLMFSCSVHASFQISRLSK